MDSVSLLVTQRTCFLLQVNLEQLILFLVREHSQWIKMFNSTSKQDVSWEGLGGGEGELCLFLKIRQERVEGELKNLQWLP